MGKGFQTDKAPEHHRQRRKELPAVDLRRGREGDLRRAYPAAPPDYDDQRHNQYGNQRLQVGAGAGATRTDPPDDGQGAQLRQQQLRIMPAEQRLAKTGGDVQAAGSPTGITDKNNQPVTLARRGPKAISTKWATPPALGKWRPSRAKTMAIGKTRRMSSGHAHRLLSPATSAASAGTAKTPVPSNEVESNPTPCPSPNSCFKPLMIQSCASEKKESITIAFPYDRLPDMADFCAPAQR